MSTKPVVVYGASGYTGRLVAEYLREFNLPFIAAGRNGARVRSVLDAVPGIETVDHEVVEVEHSVDALSELFSGATVVCNTVGPFAAYGDEVVEACHEAGCHYLDTTGEQNWMVAAEERWSLLFAERGLLLAPCLAQMYTTGEIAANLCLETPGLDTLDILVLWKGFPTYGSTQSIFGILMADHFYLEQNEYRTWPPATTYEATVPGQHQTALTLPWGGTAHPTWFRRDPRVANCKALGGIFDRELMQSVAGMAEMVENEIKPLAPDEQRVALEKLAAGVEETMPPRENQRINRSLDSVYASGPLGHVHCLLQGACNYKQTGLLQAYAAHQLVQGATRRVGFASGCQAFGHRELLAVLQSFGLSGRPVLSGAVSEVPVAAPGPALNGSSASLPAPILVAS